MQDKLYVCQGEYGGLSLQDRFDVDSMIASAEQYNGNLPYTVLGSIMTPVARTAYLLTGTIKGNRNTVVYDVVDATNEEEAKSLFLAKKRNVNRNVTIQNVRDLSNLIKQYYE